MKVFISHKQEDSTQAMLIQQAFKNNGISAYLDVLDKSIRNGGRELTEHIKEKLNECTDIIVLLSHNTRYSWWVPFEIGMSAQIDMPTASFLSEDVDLPSYLTYWPRLKTINDIDTYVKIKKATANQLEHQHTTYELSNAERRRKIETPLFYENIQRELR